MALKYLHENTKKRFSIKRALHEGIAGYEVARPLQRIHASAVTNTNKEFCPREHSIYSLTLTEQPDEFISTALGITFANGRYVQSMINEVWLADRMVGDWECKACGVVRRNRKKPTTKCTKCDKKLWAYNEVNIISKHSGISGGLDAIVDVGLDKFILVEIKTLDKDKFKELVAPFAEHRERTLLYLRLISESDHPLAKSIDTTIGVVLYVSRSHGFKDVEVYGYEFKDHGISPFKEFKIKADHKSVEKISAKGKSVKDFRLGLTPIPGKICSSIMAKRAKQCCCFKQCFSGAYPDNKYMREVEDD